MRPGTLVTLRRSDADLFESLASRYPPGVPSRCQNEVPTPGSVPKQGVRHEHRRIHRHRNDLRTLRLLGQGEVGAIGGVSDVAVDLKSGRLTSHPRHPSPSTRSPPRSRRRLHRPADLRNPMRTSTTLIAYAGARGRLRRGPRRGRRHGKSDRHDEHTLRQPRGRGPRARLECPRRFTGPQDGYTLGEVTSPTRAGQAGTLSFRILDADGAPVREYDDLHEKQLHLIVIRSDTSQFRHVHPTPGPTAHGRSTGPGPRAARIACSPTSRRAALPANSPWAGTSTSAAICSRRHCRPRRARRRSTATPSPSTATSAPQADR